MSKLRVIARIDVKNDHVIKGIHLEGLRKVGYPNPLAIRYYEDGIDEIVFMDAVASYYDRNSLSEIISVACNNVFIPITVGGGIRNVQDIQTALNSGADKVAINTQAIRTPEFLEAASKKFGYSASCFLLKQKTSSGSWEAYTDNRREPSGLDVVGWAQKPVSLGAGEIAATSIDKDGTRGGFDKELCAAVAEVVGVPVIASGSAGSATNVSDLIDEVAIDAIAVASILHYGLATVSGLKRHLTESNVRVKIMSQIAILDYELGNIQSISAALLNIVGSDVLLTRRRGYCQCRWSCASGTGCILSWNE